MRQGKCLAALVAAGAVLLAPSATAASRTSGLYLTAADYREARLTTIGDCKSDQHKLHLHSLLHKPYIDVTHEGTHHRYMKSELFGFRSCDGVDYRFAQHREFQILEARALYIYMVKAPPRLGKNAAPGLNTVATYYFSVGAEGEVLPLTLNHLKQAFPTNHRFHDSLDAAFPSGGLEQYDEFHRMFKVNHMLESSEAAVK
jgi:hypothetical protein